MSTKFSGLLCFRVERASIHIDWIQPYETTYDYRIVYKDM